MIPDAAVESAAMILRTRDYPDYQPDPEWAREVLEAAAPHIAAQALEEAAYAFEGLPMNKGAAISSGTYDWFELFPIQHIRDRAEDIRTTK